LKKIIALFLLSTIPCFASSKNSVIIAILEENQTENCFEKKYRVDFIVQILDEKQDPIPSLEFQLKTKTQAEYTLICSMNTQKNLITNKQGISTFAIYLDEQVNTFWIEDNEGKKLSEIFIKIDLQPDIKKNIFVRALKPLQNENQFNEIPSTPRHPQGRSCPFFGNDTASDNDFGMSVSQEKIKKSRIITREKKSIGIQKVKEFLIQNQKKENYLMNLFQHLEKINNKKISYLLEYKSLKNLNQQDVSFECNYDQDKNILVSPFKNKENLIEFSTEKDSKPSSVFSIL
jgi:hypothetical protein